MEEKVIDLLKIINSNLEDLKKKENLPKLLYARDIAENYKINVNKATDFCKKYGTNFGGYCIEADKFKEILQTEGTKIFNWGGKQMKRKLDKNKVYAFIGQATVVILFNVGMTVMFVAGFLQNTIY